MIEAPFALAFGAGLVATLNPCGFAMLPAYLSYFMVYAWQVPGRRGVGKRAVVVEELLTVV